MHCSQRAVWRNGGSSPQKRQCKFETLYPAGSLVEAATTPSRLDVVRHPAETTAQNFERIRERKLTKKCYLCKSK